MGAKLSVIAKVDNCPLRVEDQLIITSLIFLPLRSYDILIGMDRLEYHLSLINFNDKTIIYLDKYGVRQVVQGVNKPLKLRPITASQLVKCVRKRCQIYVVHVGYTKSKEKYSTLENILIGKEFLDVFPEDILGLSLKMYIYFTIEFILGATHVSRAPYCISVPKLKELKM